MVADKSGGGGLNARRVETLQERVSEDLVGDHILGFEIFSGQQGFMAEDLAALFFFLAERNPKLDAAGFDDGRCELLINWILGFIGRFGHVLYSIKTASYCLHLFDI